MPLFPDLFLSDSHFGNLVQPHPLRLRERLRQAHRRRPVPPPVPRRQGRHQHEDHSKIGKVTGINLVDGTSELMVISQFGKIIRIDTKSIHAAGRSTQGVKLLNPRTPGQVAAAIVIPPEESKTEPENGTVLQ
jgi:hypothetical protein